MDNAIKPFVTLDTLNINNIYNSLSDILGLDHSYIESYISSNYYRIVESHYDDDTIESMNISELTDTGNIQLINKITMHHITPRPSENSIWREGLFTLPQALISDTSLSSRLKKYGLTFSFYNNRVTMKKDNVMIDVSKLKQSNLLMRFGGDFSFDDFNVNGYLFVYKFDIECIRGWLGSPEILKNLSVAFGDQSIADSYADQCQNYYVSFDAPLDKIDLTGFSPNISSFRKTEISFLLCTVFCAVIVGCLNV